jgi:hypothetical protein
MAALTGQTIANSYGQLLKTTAAGISGTNTVIQDGLANNSCLSLSSTALASSGTLASAGNFSVATNKFTVDSTSGNTSVLGTLGCGGNFSVAANKFTVASATGNTTVAGSLSVSGATSLTGNLGVSGTATITGDFTVNTDKFYLNSTTGDVSITGLATIERSSGIIDTKTGATGTVIHDFSTTAIWSHSSIVSNFIPDITNVPTTDNRTIVITLILQQGATAYVPTTLYIAGAAQSVKWLGGVAPSGTANGIDVFTFTLVRVSSSWKVLGSRTSHS